MIQEKVWVKSGQAIAQRLINIIVIVVVIIILFWNRGVGEQVQSPVMTFVLHVLLLGTKPGSPEYKSQARVFGATSPCQAQLETTLVTCGVSLSFVQTPMDFDLPSHRHEGAFQVLARLQGFRPGALRAQSRGQRGVSPRSRGALAPEVPGVAKGGFGVPFDCTERE